jgi:hypothetical protein
MFCFRPVWAWELRRDHFKKCIQRLERLPRSRFEALFTFILSGIGEILEDERGSRIISVNGPQ